jgi:hypothetical protein
VAGDKERFLKMALQFHLSERNRLVAAGSGPLTLRITDRELTVPAVLLLGNPAFWRATERGL